MPLRTRIRRAFTRDSSDEDALSKTSSKTSRKDANVYKPGEKMPPLKYRRPVAPEHKEQLESFSWAKAWRRKSTQSMYSPMGSRMPSRKASLSTLGRRSMSLGRRKGSSRGNDGMGVDGGCGGPKRARADSDEEGVGTNTRLPYYPINDPRKFSIVGRRRSAPIYRRSQSMKSGSSHPAIGITANDRLGRRSLSTTTKGDIPFSPEELELAFKRSHLEVSKEE